ncbi:hypothetical protein Tco_1206668 [Tanacetum coccineum]
MAAPGGNNQVARRVIDDLIEFSGELFDTLMDLKDDRANARIKLQGLNKLVNNAEAEVEEKEAQVMGMIYVCVKNELCMDVLLFDL